MDVRLPDGTIIRGVPEGTSKADLVSKLSANGYDTSSLMPKTETTAQQNQPGKIASFGAGLGTGVGNVALGAQNLIGMGLEKLGAESAGQWLQRDAIEGRQKLKSEVAPYKEANPMTTGGGQLVGEVVSTLPTGGALAKGASMVPGLAQKAPGLVNALRTGGMAPGSVNTRVAGGAATGAAQAALIDNDLTSAGVGAVLGGALGGVVGKAATKVAPEGVKMARGAGYVIPPTQAGGGIVSRAGEGLSGKAATAQAASVKNQDVTNALAAKAIGLPEDASITVDALDGIRKEAGKAYDALASLPKVEPVAADSLMNIPASKGFDPKKAVYDLRVARNDADGYFKSYARTADPEALKKANAAKADASRMEKELENYAASIGQTELMPALRDARQQIAKTYTVQKALNPTTGSIDARVLAKELRKGKPLTGELKQVAEFADQFPKAAQVMEKSGGAVSLSPLDYLFAGGAGLNSLTSGGSTMDAAQNAALGLGARNAARALILSNPAQNRLAGVGTESGALVEALRKSLARMPAVSASLADRQSN